MHCQVCRAHRAALKGLDICGRIYVSAQGINAQYSGPAGDACQYARWVEGQPEFLVQPSDLTCLSTLAPYHSTAGRG